VWSRTGHPQLCGTPGYPCPICEAEFESLGALTARDLLAELGEDVDSMPEVRGDDVERASLYFTCLRKGRGGDLLTKPMEVYQIAQIGDLVMEAEEAKAARAMRKQLSRRK